MNILKALKKHIEKNHEIKRNELLERYEKPMEMGEKAWEAYLMPLDERAGAEYGKQN